MPSEERGVFMNDVTAADVIIRRNGLAERYIRTDTTCEKGREIPSFHQLQSYINRFIEGRAFAVSYLDYGVCIGKYAQGRLLFYKNEQFETKYLQRLRVFNETSELLLWRTEVSTFSARLREDEARDQQIENGSYVIDAHQVIWGTKAKRLDDGWSELTEQRGARLIVPFPDLKVDTEKNRLQLWTRHYISFYENGQAGYTDSRFVTFIQGSEHIGQSND